MFDPIHIVFIVFSVIVNISVMIQFCFVHIVNCIKAPHYSEVNASYRECL